MFGSATFTAEIERQCAERLGNTTFCSLPEAVSLYDESIDLYRALAKEEPALYKQVLAEILRQVADWNAAQAASFYEEAASLFGDLAIFNAASELVLIRLGVPFRGFAHRLGVPS
ncbi:hypothetical protein OC834_007501 [Tilletia horrida]|nr:hypothetical protein OC834_007501 [Tilletia horrida]